MHMCCYAASKVPAAAAVAAAAEVRKGLEKEAAKLEGGERNGSPHGTRRYSCTAKYLWPQVVQHYHYVD